MKRGNRTMKNKKLFITLMLSLAFNIAFLGSLGYRLYEKSRYPESRHRRVSREKHFHSEQMKLSPDQKERLKQVRKQAFEQIRMIHTHINDEKQTLARLILMGEIDSLQIEERLRHIGNLQIDIERIGTTRMLKAKEILTSEQREQFLEIVMERFKNIHSRYREKSDKKKR
jgi:Spy/CpxP family protein refolding chaperone